MKDSRGQLNVKTAVTLIVAITVTGLIASVMLPVAINALEGDVSDSFSQDVGTTESVNAELNSTLDSVDGTADTATYTLNTSDESITNTIDNGTSTTYSFTEGDVNVTVSDVNTGSPGSATATYDYPNDFAYSDGARSVWGILGLGIVLAVFLAVIGMAMSAVDRL